MCIDQAHSKRAVGGAMRKKKRILIIEDDAEVRELMRTTLTDAGYEVEVSQFIASSVGNAINRDLDLITVDLGLPEIDGSEIVGLLRAKTDVPIMVVSGYLNEEIIKGLKRKGVEHFVGKPFRISELTEAVDRRKMTAVHADIAVSGI